VFSKFNHVDVSISLVLRSRPKGGVSKSEAALAAILRDAVLRTARQEEVRGVLLEKS
jgi:hypothetical protein